MPLCFKSEDYGLSRSSTPPFLPRLMDAIRKWCMPLKTGGHWADQKELQQFYFYIWAGSEMPLDRYCFFNYNIDHYHTVYFITSIIITGGHGTNFCGGKFFRKRHFAHLIPPDRMYTDGVNLGACIKVCKTEGFVLIFCAFSYNMQWSSYMVARWYQVQFAWEMLYLICCTMYFVLYFILYYVLMTCQAVTNDTWT